MSNNNLFKRALSIVLCVVLLMAYLPANALKTAAAEPVLNIVPNSKKADPQSIIWENFFGPGQMHTEYAGAVWTDKSVFTGATNKLPGVSLVDQNNFLVALSSIASNTAITGHTSSPTDTMLVLDLSGSMVDGTYEVGYIRSGNNSYNQAYGIDMSLVEAMVKATNDTIDTLMTQNSNNRVGVVLYSGNTSTGNDATSGSATVVLPLGRYAGVAGKYLSLDANYITNTLYTYNRNTRRWTAAGQSEPYVASNSTVAVSVENGLKTESGAAVTDASKTVVGGTYIQNGLYKAMNQFLSVTDTTVPEGKIQAGVERLPVVVLMTDGAPTIATTSYTSVGTSNTGNGGSTSDRITFLTQLTAAYVRGKVAAHYQESATDGKDILFMTLGLGTENSSAATNTLYPAGSNDNLEGYWETYLAANAGTNVRVISGTNGLTVTRDSAVTAMNYVDKYFQASNAAGLIESFEQILGEIQLKAETYATLVEGDGANFSGYVTFEDALGEMMHVHDMKGIMMSDGNGGTVLYTGKGVAKSLNEGVLGTQEAPTERGDELVRTVKERIPGTTTTQAQQLISWAYLDQQLYFENDNNWSNYIGWYADAQGNYVGFWDKDSGYENAPANAAYANRSYGYLGAQEDTDMMHVVVMVRTDLRTQNQTVFFKIPAALLPTVQYKVTLAVDDPTKVEKFEREAAFPMQLVFEVGLRSDINSVNLEQKIAEHIAAGGHVHRNADGTVNFYTNEWAIGNDTNQNGIPDPDEVDTAKVAQSHFHPALDNTRYYYTEDTPVLDAAGNQITDPNASLSGGTYHIEHYYYTTTERKVTDRTIAAETLAQAQYRDGRWVIPGGTMFRELTRLRVMKETNSTGTVDYSRFSATFAAVGKQDVYSFLGNNGTFTVAPATGITLRKEVSGTIADADRFTFQVSLSNIPAGSTAVPTLTDADGNAISGVTMSAYQNGQFTVTMPAGITAYISGIPAGTNVEVAEQINGDYKVVGIQVAGQMQAADGNATLTVPAFVGTGDDHHVLSTVQQMVPVVITNAPNVYGDLIISKDVFHTLVSDPAVLAQKEFTFRLTLTGSEIAEGDTFETSAGVQVKVGAGGAVTFIDGSPIVLKNEESITILRIPEGTTYTVTEDDLPGFALDSIGGNTAATSATGSIIGNTEAMADFYNRYPDEFVPVEVPVTLKLTKELTVKAGTPADEEFVFVLQKLLDDGTYPDIADTNGQTYIKVRAGNTEQASFNLTFNNVGTYFFRVVELKPSEQTPAGTDTAGMTYSTMQALFEVIVTDENMDGALEIAVREEANVTVTGDNSGIDVSAVFENIYEVGSANTVLNVHKKLINPAIANIPLTEFHFDMVACDADGNPLAGEQVKTVTTSALGDATFNIVLDEAGTYYYLISEQIPASGRVGMDYDTTKYLYKVVVGTETVGSDTNYVITERQLTNLKTDTTVEPENGVYTAQFENTYSLTGTNVRIPYRKSLTGRPMTDSDVFMLQLVQTDGAFSPMAGGVNGQYRMYDMSGINIQLDYTQVGTYHYKLTEVIPAEAVYRADLGKYVLNGIVYDNAVYHVTVNVYDNGNGALEATKIIHKVGAAAAVDTVAFANEYVVSGEETVTIGGNKVLNGRSLVAGEVTIGLYSDPECTQKLMETANRADGTFAFPTITYTAADLGDNSAAKTYTYYIKEIPGTKGGVTYDPNVYTVTVTVSHAAGVLVVTPSNNYATLQITNSYLAQDVDVLLSGRKELSGDWTNVPNQQFRFDLFEADAAFSITDQTPVDTKYVTGADTFSISLRYTDGQEGSYYYVLKEDMSNRAGGIGYDAGEYHITVNVSDPGEGKLVAQTTIYRPGTGNTTTAVFTNVYKVEPTTATLEGNKTFTNTSNNQPMTMAGGEFQFLVLEGADLSTAKIVTTGTNRADGTIEFLPITYTESGVHEYTVVEVVGEEGGVAYSEAQFSVKVTVTDNGDGTLTAAADYNNTPVVFENTYTPGATQVILSGKKVFAGDWTAVTNKTFSFELFETDASFAVEDDAILKADNGTDGSFTFAAINYAAEGIHYYVLREELFGQSVHGVTYDSKEVHITVRVEDNGSGQLVATVETNDTAAAVASENNVVTVSGLEFTNTYQATSTSYTPAAQKDYKGEAMKQFDFVLAVNGDDEQIKRNDENGNVVFDELVFDAPGVYELEIREQENTLWGMIRWDTNVYTITLHVEDDGQGKLSINESKTEITSVKGDDELLFRNAHNDVITKKDVFLAEAPTVSIDGKAVAINDILLYKISYTNYDSVPVDIEILDELSESTAYVEGSADNGGTLSGGTLRWTVSGVEPGATVTVSFRAKVVATNVTVENTATVLEGDNKHHTNVVRNSVDEDLFVKEVFSISAPNVSVDGKAVAQGATLVYALTYTNSADKAAEVTITDTIPQNTAYVNGSADNSGVYADGKVTWVLQLAAGESKTVSFQVTVGAGNSPITNKAIAVEGENQLESNQTTNTVTVPSDIPKTGDNTNLALLATLMLSSVACLFVLTLSRKRMVG